ncbi:MAG: hypothetical protein JJT99_05875 [Rhodobacteraceae bacterium]|nr:hypothetical protein [Paracoccaceae bacterium]
MAYIDLELQNARIIWRNIADRVLVIALILAAMGVASLVSAYLGYAPQEMMPMR